MEGTVREALIASGKGPQALWAKFDAEWYKRAYPVAHNVHDTLEFYLTQGARLGHSPNPLFDETWYVAQYPVVATAIAEGKFRSGFDHYCQYGLHDRSPHWLFDFDFYRDKYPDLNAKSLADSGFVNHYDHYLKTGAREGRIAHLLFCPTSYRAHVTEHGGYVPAGDFCPFMHYLQAIEGPDPEVRVSLYFDPEWYLLNYPEVIKDVDHRKYKCALHHYLSNDNPAAYDPVGYFREQYYLERYPDVVAHIGTGRPFRNGYMHFLRYGQRELRNPAPFVNLQYYWSRRSDVVVGTGVANTTEPFVHLLTIGVPRGGPFAPAGSPIDVPEKQGQALFLAHAENMVALHAKKPLDFTVRGAAKLSVIVVVHNHLAMSLMALASLRDNYAGQVQLILIDSGSTDETRFIEQYVRGAVYVRFETNVGFVHACNTALLHVDAPKLLFLNNDIQLSSGALAAAMERLDSDPKIGAVGAKVVRTNEKLQEAGCIVWRDGSGTGYLRDRSPLCPEANFVRDVDFVSGVFLMTRAELIAELGGFDTQFAPAYYEDTDLCLRIWDAGLRVVYDPNVVIYHYEYGSSYDPSAAFALMQRNQKAFFTKHFQRLKHHYTQSAQILASARFAGVPRPKILYIEDFIPLRGLGAGAVRSNDLIRVMTEAGYRVTVFPVHGTSASLAEIYGDFSEEVEIMHDVTYHDLQSFLADRGNYYDCIWICRSHNLNLLKPILEQASLDPKKTVTVLDTEAIFSIREALQAKRKQQRFDLKRAMAREFEHAHFCQEIVTVSESEAAALKRFGFPHARVVGTYRPIHLTPRSWQERSGLLFVGSLYAADTPNFDSLCWFVDEILPRVEEELGWETRLSIVGHAVAGVPLHRITNHTRVTWHGPVADLEHIYDTHRVVIAPTRFAAGTPYKVYEAASFGVPAVITDLLTGQLGWMHENEVLSAAVDDAEAFAAHIVRLYRSQELWNSLRQAAAERLLADHSKERYIEALSHVLPAL